MGDRSYPGTILGDVVDVLLGDLRSMGSKMFVSNVYAACSVCVVGLS